MSRRNFVLSSAAASVAWNAHASKHQDRRDDALDGESTVLGNAVNWHEFLARHDLLWDTVPTTWGESPFLGNGKLAVAVRAQPGDHQALWFSIDNTDVYDRRDPSWGRTAYSRSRYHVGDFVLTPVGVITGLRMRLVLHDAELVGSITTSAGSIDFVAFVHADRMIAVVELKTSDGEEKCRWDWRAGQAISSRKPGCLRIFPAVPAQWKDLVFQNLRAQGAFLVSACMRDSKLSWVRVKSLQGEPCQLKCSFPKSPRSLMSDREVDVLVSKRSPIGSISSEVKRYCSRRTKAEPRHAWNLCKTNPVRSITMASTIKGASAHETWRTRSKESKKAAMQMIQTRYSYA